MTPTRRRECLDILGWTQRGLAAVVGYDERTVRRWFAGHDMPADVEAWLERRALAMQADPPPPIVQRAVGRPRISPSDARRA